MASKWNPVYELDASWDEMDPIFEESLARALDDWTDQTPIELSVPISVYETDVDWVLYADLPGVKPDDIDITITGYTLKIKGEFQTDEESTIGSTYARERCSGRFQRTVALPASIDQSGLEVAFRSGVLKVVLPKKERSNRYWS